MADGKKSKQEALTACAVQHGKSLSPALLALSCYGSVLTKKKGVAVISVSLILAQCRRPGPLFPGLSILVGKLLLGRTSCFLGLLQE